ncbi:MAG: hypothetical protein MK095_04075 [Phycisphaerales bacterium]|nr:hypothetical protein [Phycisphaerales bacterium]
MTTLHLTALLTTGLLGNVGPLTSIGLEEMAQRLRGDVRVIVMGDSYSSPYINRMPMATLQCWPIPFMSAIQGGAATSSHLVQCIPYCSTSDLIQVSDADGYTAERSSDNAIYFGLPVRGAQEAYGDDAFSSGTDGKLFEFRLREDKFDDGVHGSFSQPDDDLKFRLLHLAPGMADANAVQHVELINENGQSTPTALVEGVRPHWHLGGNPEVETGSAVERQINAAAIDIDCTRGPTARHRVRLHESDVITGSNRYLQPAGGIWYQCDESGVRRPGFYYSYLADDGWSYFGFGGSSGASSSHDRRCSESQVTHWMDVTTLDRNQPVVVLWYLAFEPTDETTARVHMNNMIDRIDAGAQAVGLTDIQHLLVVPHMITFSVGDGPEARALAEQQQAIAFELAQERANVATASLYAATDGVLFDGRPEAVDWLLDHGFDDFHYGSTQIDLVSESNGDLLDYGEIHPVDEHASAFLATLLGNLIREAGCPADIHVDGVINVQDLLVILSEWGESGSGDVDDNGITDVLDLLKVIESWGVCWPVQAPYAE